MALTSKTYLITGSTDGIGYHTAKNLARNGASILLHGRSQSKVEAAVEAIRGQTKGCDIKGLVADLSSIHEVHNLADQVMEAVKERGLSVLINNAGVFEQTYSTTIDNLERTWAVNVAAPFVLTSLLLSCIKERVVTVASISASSSMDIDNTQCEKTPFSPHGAYSLSRVADIIFSVELSKRLNAHGKCISSFSLDPGTVNTKMLFAGWGSIGMDVEDANDEYWVATAPELTGKTGLYFVGRREQTPPTPVHDNELRKKLWQLLERQTGTVYSI